MYSYFILIIKNRFIDFFGFDTTKSICPTSRITNPANNNYFLNNCYFNSLTTQFNGGSISISLTTEIRICIENSIFFQSSSFENGGAIYFSCSNGMSALSNVCGNYCYTTNVDTHKRGQFCLISGSDSKTNQLSFVSVYKCAPNQLYFGYCGQEIRNGISTTQNSNNSYGSHYHVQGFDFTYTTNLRLRFSSLVSSNPKKENSFTSICLNSHSGITEVEYCNFIKNYSPHNTRGIFDSWVSGQIMVSHCIYSDNFGILFAGNGNSIITIKNSHIYHLSQMTSGNVNLLNNQNYENSILTYIIYHFKTHLCEANDFPTIISIPFLSCNIRKYQKYPFIFFFFIYI